MSFAKAGFPYYGGSIALAIVFLAFQWYSIAFIIGCFKSKDGGEA